MKLFALSLSLVCLGFSAGCNGGDNRNVTGQPVDTSASADSDQAKQSIQKGADNARITQQVMKSRKLPNGQPLPGPGNPIMQPPGFHG